MTATTHPRLYLVRHGRTAWNEAGKLLSRTDEPLNEEGELQASELGRQLAEIEWGHVRVSPAIRAQRTAELILAAADHDVGWATDERLHEVDFGPYEGWTERDFAADPVASAARSQGIDLPGMETMASVEARAGEVWSELCALPGTTLVVGHGRMLRGLIVRFVLSAPASTVSALRLRHCRPAIVEPGDRPLLLGLNVGDPSSESLERLG